ncbi:peptide/nickel transport system permease protein [Deinobacterium chartae]|uniref:Peptide/nickel transport system permease protein n=1 Tax=Deinobacterium chartae TaxID=521158 RepID=A0A841I5M9_9DEIO|nr:ABC transporter permease [Deinobacterium chartae]MBB6099579.1 peptide/nickel transport system permease protein [Deinobacterium chartae]
MTSAASNATRTRTFFQAAWVKFRKHKLARVGGAVLLLLYLAALFADFLAPYPEIHGFRNFSYAPPTQIHFQDEQGRWTRPFVYGFQIGRDPNTFQKILIEDKSKKFPLYFFVRGEPYKLFGFIPADIRLFGGPAFTTSSEEVAVFLWGADDFGRDIWGRIWYGARVSLCVGIAAALCAIVLGMFFGGLAGFYAGINSRISFGYGNRELYAHLRAARGAALAWMLLKRVGHLALCLGMAYLAYTTLVGYLSTARGLELFIGSLFVAGAAWLLYVLFWTGIRLDPDNVIMRLTEVLSAIPGLLLLVILRALFPQQLSPTATFYIVVAILALVGWGGLARVIRSQILSIREAEYSQAARALGASDTRIIVRHILPQVATYLIVTVSLAIPGFILSESGLSFLNLGISEPAASWGLMLSKAQANGITAFTDRPFLLIPGFFIFLAILSWSFLGDGLRDAFDPRSK